MYNRLLWVEGRFKRGQPTISASGCAVILSLAFEHSVVVEARVGGCNHSSMHHAKI